MEDKLMLVLQHLVLTQDRLNSVVDEDWKGRDRKWLRAVWVEAGEAMDYLPWDWWKSEGVKSFRSHTHRTQFWMELADILCFGVSHEITQDRFSEVVGVPVNIRTASYLRSQESMSGNQVVGMTVATTTDQVERIAKVALMGAFSFDSLVWAAESTGLSFDRLLAFYYGKVALNEFRQAHGYKQGNYRKNWGTKEDPREDNEFLASWIEESYPTYDDILDRSYAVRIIGRMEDYYSSLPPL